MLKGEVAQLARQQEQPSMIGSPVDFDSQLYQTAYTEVESLVGMSWLKMRDKRRVALTF